MPEVTLIYGPEIKIVQADNSVFRILIAKEECIYLSQMDVRELQKAKRAIRAAVDVLMEQLELQPTDLERVILTGSFGGEVDIDAILDLGLFAHGEMLAERAAQVDLDQDANFYDYHIAGMKLAPYRN